MSNELTYELENFLEAMSPFIIANNIYALFGIVSYVLIAVSLFCLAKRRGINHAWLSWIPVGNVWILGSLSDQYRYVARGEVKNKRKILLVLSLAHIVLTIVSSVMILISFTRFLTGAFTPHYSTEELFKALAGLFTGTMTISLLFFLVWAAGLVIRFMALYDVYRSTSPDTAVLFLVLSIFLRITQPFFLFFTRQRDDGMHRQEEQKEDQYTGYQAPGYASGSPEGAVWNEPMPHEQETRQNPEGSPEPWTEHPEQQDPWNQGPEQL